MALGASSPAAPPRVDYDQMGDDLDDEIRSIRAEIQALTQRRKLLSATLLSSSAIQSQLKDQIQSTHEDLPEDITPLLASSQQHAETNLHRLAYGVTAFPFLDPSPETSHRRLLGIRIDICKRDGKFGKPYYLLCKRADDNISNLRIHRHTIPVFIPLEAYEEQYLPLQDEGYASPDGSSVKQDLHALVRNVRHDLVSWTRRREAIDMLGKELNLAVEKDSDAEMEDDEDGAPQDENEGHFGVRSVSAVSVEAKYAKIVWKDGRAGRVKISDEGMIERAVVFGDEGRVRSAERLLSEGNVSIKELASRLELLHQETSSPEGDEQVSQ